MASDAEITLVKLPGVSSSKFRKLCGVEVVAGAGPELGRLTP